MSDVKNDKDSSIEDKQKIKDIPDASFSNFILSLNAQALVFLGVLPHPETNKIDANILISKHTIDLLEILKEKTKGNLTQEEASLLDEILFRLRVVYVEVQKKGEKNHDKKIQLD
ncbi:MAG TPA: DUF1844 domain-containing protein [bacterium]